MIDERALNIYTDGSSKQKPRRGGIGIRYIYVDDSGTEVSKDLRLPGYSGANSQEMELNACIVALENAMELLQARSFNRIIVFSDSSYVVNFHKYAMFVWPKTKWLKKSGGPVLNVHLWKRLIHAMRDTKKRVEFQKVKGHSKDEHNKAVDRLAKQSAAIPLNAPLAIRTVRRKQSKERTRIGSVEMLGQKLSIRIIEGQYLPQKIYRYRYEVISKNSPYYKKVDFACSIYPLREAHAYSVRMNADSKNPQVVKLFKEIDIKKKSGEPA